MAKDCSLFTLLILCVLVIITCAINTEHDYSCGDEYPTVCQCHDDRMTCTSLQVFPEFTPPPNINTMIFQLCHFKFLDSIKNLHNSNITHLSLRNSQIATLADDVFQDMRRLTFLDLGVNFIQNVDNYKFKGLRNLKFLTLEHNKLRVLPFDTLNSMPNLESLDLDSNSGLVLETDVLTSSLTYLSMKYCELTEVPPEISDTDVRLKKLTIDGNNFKILKRESFIQRAELEHLSMDSCNIEEIEVGAFYGLYNLKTLRLGHNSLKHIETLAMDHARESVRRFYLNDNLLETIPYNLMRWDYMDEEIFEGNPLHCDCRLHYMNRLNLSPATV